MAKARHFRTLRTIPVMIAMALLALPVHGRDTDATGEPNDPHQTVTEHLRIIYVDANATGANDGVNWANAYVCLQDALAHASSAEKPAEIWVAQGIYTPDSNSIDPNGTGKREATFQLIDGVSIYGGFPSGGSEFERRDPNLYETILSGDLDGNDGPVSNPSDSSNDPNRAENSYHVASGSSTDETALLDGFVLSAGNADGLEYPHYFGGGLLNIEGSPTIANCTFRRNSADGNGGGMCNWIACTPSLTKCEFMLNTATYNGGGMCNEESSPSVTSCTFRRNIAGENGAGMAINTRSSPALIDCSFSENSAGSHGGAMEIWSDSSPTLTRCTFTENSTLTVGGAIDIGDGSNPVLETCVFSRNTAQSHAGGIYFLLCSPIVTSCVFSGNESGEAGGAVVNDASNPIFIHCIFSGNSAMHQGGALYSWRESRLSITNCTFSQNAAASGWALACSSEDPGYPSDVIITNCILWDNGDEIWNDDGSTITVSYSNIQSLGRFPWPGIGNINTDPLFADPDSEDYHLRSETGRWDPLSENWVRDDVTSPCLDAGAPNTPTGFEPFPNGGIINIGAYGGTSEASKSPTGFHPKYGGGTGEPNDPR